MRYSQLSLAITLYDDGMFRATMIKTRWKDGRMVGSEVLRQAWADDLYAEELVAEAAWHLVREERDLQLERG